MAQPLNIDQLLELLDTLPEDQHLPIVQKHISSIADPKERRFLEAVLMSGRELGREKKRKHIVALVHGIRTRGPWQERFAIDLKSVAPEVEVVPVGYKLNLLGFLCPFFTRNKPINIVARQLQEIRADCPDADISILAHSFGTYIISQILQKHADIKLNRIQLCGSIVPAHYEWSLVKARINGAIVNDVGTRDYLPLLAKYSSVGYGSTGLFGFKKYPVVDNFHDLGHSDFFLDEHPKKYWVPFLVDGHSVSSSWNSELDKYAPLERMSRAGMFLSAVIIGLAYVIAG